MDLKSVTIGEGSLGIKIANDSRGFATVGTSLSPPPPAVVIKDTSASVRC